MSYARIIAKGSAYVLLFTVLSSVLGFLVKSFLARNLATSDFGLLYAVMAFTGIFWVFKDLGYSSGLVRYIAEWNSKQRYDDIRTSIWWGIIFQGVLGTIIFVILFFGADFFAVSFFENKSATFLIQMFALEILVGIYFVRHVLLGYNKIFVYASSEFVRNIFLMALLAIFISMGIAGAGISYLLASLLFQAVFIYYIFFRLLKDPRPKIAFSAPQRKIFVFGSVLFVGQLANYLISYADTLLLTAIRTLEDVGLYQAALPISQLLWAFPISLAVALLPSFSELWGKNNVASIADGTRFAMKFMFIFLILPLFIVIIWPDILLGLIFGEAYLRAADALRILAIGSIFHSLMMLNNTVLHSIESPRAITLTAVAISVLNVVLNFYMISKFGIAGAAYATTLSFVVGFVITLYFLRKRIALKLPWSDILKILAAGLLTVILMQSSKEWLVLDIFTEVATVTLLGFVFYAILVKLLRVIERQDMEIMESAGLKIPETVKKLLVK